MAKLWNHSVEVEGTGSFPVDMLRHDHCWPISTEDAMNVISHDWRNPGEKRRVHISTVRSTKAYPFTDGRWASFGWKVDTGTKRTMESGL